MLKGKKEKKSHIQILKIKKNNKNQIRAAHIN